MLLVRAQQTFADESLRKAVLLYVIVAVYTDIAPQPCCRKGPAVRAMAGCTLSLPYVCHL